VVLWEGVRSLQAPSEIIKTQKNPNLTASEQYTFVECKKKNGKYNDYHRKDMLSVLSKHGISPNILETQRVKELVKQQIENGACDFFSDHDRITDTVANIQASDSSYRKLSGWKLYTINMYAEAECKLSTGEISSREEQESLLNQRLSTNESKFSEVDEAEFMSFIKANTSTMAWLTLQKKSKKDCSYEPAS
jgi:hypothetical protein